MKINEEVLMPMWRSGPGETAADAVLREWRVQLTDAGSKHFVGKCARTGLHRVSPPIISFTPDTRTGATEQGELFVLSGPPGRDTGLLQLVWLIATWNNKVSGSKDITAEYEWMWM
jgi:hypothetical protein